jgi:hypothetical protein
LEELPIANYKLSITHALSGVARVVAVARDDSARRSGGDLRSVGVVQEDVMVGPSIASRFFDPFWRSGPAGGPPDWAVGRLNFV